MEAKHDAALGPPRPSLGVSAQGRDVVAHCLARGLDVLVGDAREVGRVDDHVHIAQGLEVTELTQLQRGEGGLQRPAPADDEDLPDTTGL